MRLINLFIITFIIATLMIGNSLYQLDSANQELRDIYNYTSNLDFNIYNFTSEEPTNKEEIIFKRIINIFNKFIEFMFYGLMEVVKTGIEFGYENPKYNYDFAFDIFKLILILAIVSIFIPLIIPLIAIITIMCMGINNLIKKLKRNNGN